jgi:hypothetical protein
LLNSVERYTILYDSGESESAAQQPVTPTPATPRKMERVRGPAYVGQKSWRVFSIAWGLPLPWGSPPLGGVFHLRDWVRAALRLVPLPGQGTAAQNMCSFV